MSRPPLHLDPGIYGRGVVPDYETYARIDALSQSTLTRIATSPLHFRAKELGQVPDVATVPMRLGDAAHCAVTEPHLFASRFAVWEPLDRKPDFRGKEFEDFLHEAMARGQRVIKPAERDHALAIGTAVHRHPTARKYLARGHAEQTIVWVDKETGIRCKARVDFLSTSIRDADIGIELKTARSIVPRVFDTVFAQRAYDIQCAWYADGYRTITDRALYMKCISVESAVPYDVIVHDALEAMGTGRDLYRAMLEQLAACRKTNLWPGQLSEGERSIKLPRWRSDPDGTGDAEGAPADLDWGEEAGA